MKMQTIRLPSDNALRCHALAQENAALCLTPWDWPLTLAGAVLAGAACVVECALTDRYTRP